MKKSRTAIFSVMPSDETNIREVQDYLVGLGVAPGMTNVVRYALGEAARDLRARQTLAAGRLV